MKTRDMLKVANKYGTIYLCLALFFAFGWFTHYLALMRMKICNRQFPLMNDKTLKSMVLIDFLNSNLWIPIAYECLVVIAVLSLQIRQHLSWSYWLVAIVLCIPCVVYWSVCAYIQGKFIFL